MSTLHSKVTYVGKYTWQVQDSTPMGEAGRTGDVWNVKNLTHPYGPISVGVMKKPSSQTPYGQKDQLSQIFSERDALRSIFSNIPKTTSKDDVDFQFLVPEVLDNGVDFLVMKKADGVALRDLSLSRGDERSILVLLRIVIGTIKVLEVAHSLGVLYGDFIKEDHVFWDEKSYIFTLIDWGNTVRFDTISGNSYDEKKTVNDDLVQVVVAIKKFLKNYPEIINSILDGQVDGKYSLRRMLEQAFLEYHSRNRFFQKKKELPYLSDFDDYRLAIDYIRQDENSYRGIAEKNQQFFKETCRNYQWQRARLILQEFPFLSSFSANAVVNTLNFIENHVADDSDTSWIVDKVLIGIDEFSEEEWQQLIRLNIDYSNTRNRNLWKELVKSTGVLINKDVNFLYDELIGIQEMLVKKAVSYPKQIFFIWKEWDGFLRDWHNSPVSWVGLSYSQFIYTFEVIREFFWEKLSVEEQDRLESVWKKTGLVEALAQQLLGDWENWEKGRLEAILNTFTQIQELDPDRRQIDVARKVIDSSLDTWLALPYHIDSFPDDLAVAELKSAIEIGNGYSEIFSSAEWLRTKIENLQGILSNYEPADTAWHEHMLSDSDSAFQNSISITEDNISSDNMPGNLVDTPLVDVILDNVPGNLGDTPLVEVILDNVPDNLSDNSLNNYVISESLVKEIPEESEDSRSSLSTEEFSGFIKNGDLRGAKKYLEEFDHDSVRYLYDVVSVFEVILHSIKSGQADLVKVKNYLANTNVNEISDSNLSNLFRWIDLFQSSWTTLTTSEIDIEFGTWKLSELAKNKINKALFFQKLVLNFPVHSESEYAKSTAQLNNDKDLLPLVNTINDLARKWRQLVSGWNDQVWKDFVKLVVNFDANISEVIEKSDFGLVRNNLDYQNTKMFHLIKIVTYASSEYEHISAHPGKDFQYGRDFLEKLQKINAYFVINAALYPNLGRWRWLFDHLLAVPYRNYNKIYRSHVRDIEHHPLVNWLMAYRPSPGLLDELLLTSKKGASEVISFTGKAVSLTAKLIIVTIIIFLLLMGLKLSREYRLEVLSGQVVTSPTPTEQTVVLVSPTTELQNEVSNQPIIKFCDALVQEKDNKVLLDMLLSLDLNLRDQLRVDCSLDRSYSEIVAELTVSVVDTYLKDNKYQAVLDLLASLPEDIKNNKEINLLRVKTNWMGLLFDICSQPSLSSTLSLEGAEALDWYISSRPEYVSKSDIEHSCSISLDPVLISQNVQPNKSSLLISSNFSTRDLYFAGAYNVSVDDVSATSIFPFRIFPTMLFNMPYVEVYKSAPWTYLDRLETTLSRAYIPYELADNTGWGIYAGSNGAFLVGSGRNIQVHLYQDGIISNEVVKEFQGISITDMTSIRLQMVGNYAFILYSNPSNSKQVGDYELLPIPPILINENPDLYFSLVNNSPSGVQQIRFIVEKMDVFFRPK